MPFKALSLPIVLRPAEWEDLPGCLALDASYQNEEVWQMFQESEAGLTGVAVRFQAARPPRAVQVPYPRTPDELQSNWQHQDAMFVAVQQSPIQNLETGEEELHEQLVGYVDLHEQRWQRAAWVQNLVVALPFRRRRVGTALLHQAAAWARQEGLERLIVESTTKNGAALHFFHKRGARFCGFNDRYYTCGDIALFFEYRL